MRFIIWSSHRRNQFVTPLVREAASAEEAAQIRSVEFAPITTYESGFLRVIAEHSNDEPIYFRYDRGMGLGFVERAAVEPQYYVEQSDWRPEGWQRSAIRTRHGFQHGELVRLVNTNLAARPGALARVDLDWPGDDARWVPIRWIDPPGSSNRRNQSDGGYSARDIESACPMKT